MSPVYCAAYGGSAISCSSPAVDRFTVVVSSLLSFPSPAACIMEGDEVFEDQMDLLQKMRRREAMAERRVKGIKFVIGANKPDKVKSGLKGMRHEVVDKAVEQDEEEKDMCVIMGFSKFGHQKPVAETSVASSSAATTSPSAKPKPRSFDLQQLVQESVQIARKTCGTAAIDDGKDDDDSADQPATTERSDSEEEDFVGPPLPPGFSGSQTEQSENRIAADSDFSDSDGDEETGVRYSRLPITNDISLQHGSKNISALAVDTNGARCVSGSYDYEIRFWDFERMDHNLNSFRAITPCECHPIIHLEFSGNGERILVIASNCQAKIVDRDGFVKATTVKGDQYIRDMANTKGHTAALNSGCWHPQEKDDFITCSNDGSIRIWNVNETAKQQKNLIKPRNSGGLRAIPNSVATSKDGVLVAAGCSDGSIQGWDLRRNMFVNTSLLLRNCHTPGSEISAVSFSYLGTYLASRATDDTLKLWDIRNTKQVVHSFESLPNRFATTDCSFSPDDKLVLTGTSCLKGASDSEAASLAFFDTSSFDKKTSIPFPSSVIRSQWHPRLNQIFVGTADGIVKVFYDEKLSDRGAMLCAGKVRKRGKEAFMLTKPQIITPHALPMFKEERKKSWKVQQLKDRADPVKSRKPELPMTGPGAGGRLANSGSTYASYIARNIATRNKLDDTMDPREAILRHAKEAAENPYWVDKAYQTTQPKPIFQKVDDDSDSDGEEANKKRKLC